MEVKERSGYKEANHGKTQSSYYSGICRLTVSAAQQICLMERERTDWLAKQATRRDRKQSGAEKTCTLVGVGCGGILV